MTVNTMAAEARRHFEKSFGAAPVMVVSAAGRVNLIGEHVDYVGGLAMPMAIQRRTAVAITVRGGERTTRINSGGTGGVLTIAHDALEHKGRWTDYPSGVLQQLIGEGIDIPGLDVAVASDVPSGSGLSSSAALEVSFGFAVREALGLPTDPVALGLLCQRAEREFVGVPCGAMDQLSSACGRAGHALEMEFAPVRVTPVPFAEPLLIVDTAVPRHLRSSQYETRVEECAAALAAIREHAPDVPNLASATLDQLGAATMDPVVRQRAHHVITECQRVREAARRMASGERFPGDLALASHASLRDDYDCSSPELDWIVERAMRTSGVRGARLTGAGWGGCAIVFGSADSLATVAEELPGPYAQAFGHRARSWLVTADDGLRRE